MRVIRVVSLAVAAGLFSAAVVGCATTVSGRGTLAADASRPTRTGGPTDSPSATSSGDPTPTDTPTETPTPTVDPVKTKEQVTCVLIQATVKTTNDKFNAAKTREAQVSILRSGVNGVSGGLARSGLARNDRIFVLGAGILNELRRLVTSANRGASPSTTPYNNATNRFRTACLSL
jgi:hypothetical protein